MECGVSVRVARTSLLLALLFTIQICRAELAVVLVAEKDSPITNISTLDIRKVYLGIYVAIDGENIRAVRWRNDDRLNQIFLQSVIAMSRRSYQRRLLSLMLKYGTPRPVEIDDHDELYALLQEHPMTVAYMWKIDAESNARVKIIRVLWQET